MRLGIGGLFLGACISKIANPESFAIAVNNYHFLPSALVNLWAIFLPWVEAFVGILIILGIFVEASALLSALMYLSFFIALSFALSKGFDISCGCFNPEDSNSKINTLYLFRDGALLLVSVWILIGYQGKIALEQLRGKQNRGE